jgi:hypothetical protein
MRSWNSAASDDVDSEEGYVHTPLHILCISPSLPLSQT